MKLFTLKPHGFAANTYVLTEDGVNAVVIDPAQPRIAQFLEEHHLNAAYVLLTHGHFDHIGGAARLQQLGAKVACLNAERDVVEGDANMGAAFGMPVAPVRVDFTFADGEALRCAGMEFHAIATPGHTKGGCCLLAEDMLFTGDTLFCGDIGRTDLPTGDEGAMQASLRRLRELLGDYKIYPGHGECGTLQREREENPYLKSC